MHDTLWIRSRSRRNRSSAMNWDLLIAYSCDCVCWLTSPSITRHIWFCFPWFVSWYSILQISQYRPCASYTTRTLAWGRPYKFYFNTYYLAKKINCFIWLQGTCTYTLSIYRIDLGYVELEIKLCPVSTGISRSRQVSHAYHIRATFPHVDPQKKHFRACTIISSVTYTTTVQVCIRKK
jgi:hypothetical protein